MKKKICMIIMILLIGTLLFAGGVGEAIAGIVLPTLAGAALGFINPILGAIGMVGGLGVGVASVYTQNEADVKQDKQNDLDAYSAALQNYHNIDSVATQNKLSILQTEQDISAYDQALARLPGQIDLQRAQMEAQGQAQYSQLMNNWQGAELVNAARGQSGGSAALIAESQKSKVEQLAGKDLKLDYTGGLYGMMMNEFNLDNKAQYDELIGNRDISQQALKIYQDNYSKAQQELVTAGQNLDEMEVKIRDYGPDKDLYGQLDSLTAQRDSLNDDIAELDEAEAKIDKMNNSKLSQMMNKPMWSPEQISVLKDERVRVTTELSSVEEEIKKIEAEIKRRKGARR